MKAPPSPRLRRASEKFLLDRIYRIARIEYEGMNDRSEAPHALVRGEALRNHIKPLLSDL